MRSVKEIMDEMMVRGTLPKRCRTCKPDCAGRHTHGPCDMRCGCKAHAPKEEARNER